MKTAQLFIFPILEAFLFSVGIYLMNANISMSLILFFLSALFLNFSLHISFHYRVHFKNKSKLLNIIIDNISSILLGMPFHYYQMSHWNHHKYDNNIGDFTSTWKSINGKIVSKNFLKYAFLWPFSGSQTISQQIGQGYKEGYFNMKDHKNLKSELMIILLFILTLFYINIVTGFIYLIVIYAGWSMIAMHNYGQHLPLNYGALKANSFYNKYYNKLFINNGLHFEHHQKPELKYWELEAQNTGKINHPHLIEGFYFLFKSKQ